MLHLIIFFLHSKCLAGNKQPEEWHLVGKVLLMTVPKSSHVHILTIISSFFALFHIHFGPKEHNEQSGASVCVCVSQVRKMEDVVNISSCIWSYI